MNIGYKITGYSKKDEEQICEVDIDETPDRLKALLGLSTSDAMMDVYELKNDEQKSFFLGKYQMQFTNDVDYFVEAYQR